MKKLVFPAAMLSLLATPALAESTITVTHGATPAPAYIDLGAPGESVGDQRIFQFPGKTDQGEAVEMDFLMTTTGQSQEASGIENRMTSAVFAFGAGGGDRILMQGIGPYPKQGSTVKISGTLERAIIGGTGRFGGARGTVLTTHLEDGTWKHVLRLE